jgi:hypothetical protein
MSRHLRGSHVIPANFPGASAPGLDSFAPSGAGACEADKGNAPVEYVLLSIVIEAFVSPINPLCGPFRAKEFIGAQTWTRPRPFLCN